MNLINRIVLVLLLLVSIVFLKYTSFPQVIHFLNFFPIVSSIGTFNYDLTRFLCDPLSPVVHDDYSCKDFFYFVSQIKNANLSAKFLVLYEVTSLFTNIALQETIDGIINLILNDNLNLNFTKNWLKNFSFLLHHILIFFSTINFIIRLMD